MKNQCNSCGLCCKLFYINLSREEYESEEYITIFRDICKVANFDEARSCGANLLEKKENGECVYLMNDKCGIHHKRPIVCRDFFCTSMAKKFEEMINIIEKEKRS